MVADTHNFNLVHQPPQPVLLGCDGLLRKGLHRVLPIGLQALHQVDRSKSPAADLLERAEELMEAKLAKPLG
jgi:hypothetical protein